MASADEPVGRLVAVVRGFVVHHARNHTSARIVNYELAALSPAHLEEIAGLRRAIEQELRDVVEDGVRLGAFTTSNPRMTALALLSLGIDVARWFRDEGEWDPEDVAAHYCEPGTEHGRRDFTLTTYPVRASAMTANREYRGVAAFRANISHSVDKTDNDHRQPFRTLAISDICPEVLPGCREQHLRSSILHRSPVWAGDPAAARGLRKR